MQGDKATMSKKSMLVVNTPNLVTQQETFDTVVAHLRGQNKKAVDSATGECRYRASEGLKCAVGCLIPDEEYNSTLESCSIGSLCHENRLPPSLRQHDFSLLADLQVIHDHYSVDAWEERFEDLAKECGLKYTKPE